jgi:hypothetical protein
MTKTFDFDAIELPDHTATILGHEYVLAELTQPVLEATKVMQEKYKDVGETEMNEDPELARDALIDALNIRLVAKNGGPPLGESLSAAFADGKVSMNRLVMLQQWVDEADNPPA